MIFSASDSPISMHKPIMNNKSRNDKSKSVSKTVNQRTVITRGLNPSQHATVAAILDKVLPTPKVGTYSLAERRSLLDPNSEAYTQYSMARRMIMRDIFSQSTTEQQFRVRMHSGPQLILTSGTTGSITPASVQIDFTNMINANTSAYTALFDEYQFGQGEVVCQPCLAPVQPSGGTPTYLSGLACLAAYVEYDNSTAPSGASYAMQQDDSRIVPLVSTNPVRDAVHWPIKAAGIPDQQWNLITTDQPLCWLKYAWISSTGSVPVTSSATVAMVYYALDVVFRGIN